VNAHLALLAAAMRAYDATVERCARCGATWTIDEGSECRWCAEGDARLLGDQRQALLWPDWATKRDDRYYRISPEDQEVWDATRGIPRGEKADGARRFYGERLRRAVDAGLITMREADDALRRVTAWEKAA
jgi:hypothetical protein